MIEHKLRCIDLKSVLSRGTTYGAGLPKVLNFACLHGKNIQVVVRRIGQTAQMFTPLADNSSSTSDSSEISEYSVSTVFTFSIVLLFAFRYSKGGYMPVVNFVCKLRGVHH